LSTKIIQHIVFFVLEEQNILYKYIEIKTKEITMRRRSDHDGVKSAHCDREKWKPVTLILADASRAGFEQVSTYSVIHNNAMSPNRSSKNA